MLFTISLDEESGKVNWSGDVPLEKAVSLIIQILMIDVEHKTREKVLEELKSLDPDVGEKEDDGSVPKS